MSSLSIGNCIYSCKSSAATYSSFCTEAARHISCTHVNAQILSALACTAVAMIEVKESSLTAACQSIGLMQSCCSVLLSKACTRTCALLANGKRAHKSGHKWMCTW